LPHAPCREPAGPRSLPTRRSSDLARYLKATFPALYKPIGGQSPSPSSRPAAPGLEMDPTLGAPLTPAERAAAEAARLKALRDALDRKSTRLNSSHVTTSHAGSSSR